jgi:hypothetical protein
MIASDGLPMRFAPETVQIVTQNMNAIEDTPNLGECMNWKKEVHSVSDIVLCEINAKPAHNAMFWGDSHVAQLYPLIQKINATTKVPAIFAVSGSCPPVERLNEVAKGFHCDDFAHYAMLRALQDDIDTVFIGFVTWFTVSDEPIFCLSQKGRCLSSLTPDSEIRELIAGLSEDIAALRARGKKVVIFLPFPIFDKSPPHILARNAMLGRFGILQSVHEISSPDVREKLMKMAAAVGADVFDPRISLCQGDACLYQKNGISLYSDQHHIAAGKIDILEDQMRRALLHYSDF